MMRGVQTTVTPSPPLVYRLRFVQLDRSRKLASLYAPPPVSFLCLSLCL